ncbi:MAG: hypothetical protein K0Q49_1611 [Haloplasmataceae bacterium]|jgi:hypothetical protein|nr:hypothetical protein [Haloplasmataceae bacterium]
MGNITKSARLEMLFFKTYFKQYLLILITPVIFAVFNKSLLTGVNFTMCITAIMSNMTFDFTEKSNLSKLYGLIPVKRKHIVLGKYLFVMILGLITFIITFILSSITLYFLNVNIDSTEISFSLFGLIAFVFFTAIQIPLLYKYGATKARLVMNIPFIGIVGIVGLLKLIDSIKVQNILNNYALFIVSMIILLTLILECFSMYLSVKIYKIKEL